VSQATSNAQAASVPALGADFDRVVHDIYDRHFRASIHPRW